MKIHDYAWWAVRSLRYNRLRALLTALGIVIGVAAIISLQAIGHGFQDAIFNQLFKLNPDVIFVLPKVGTLTDIDVTRLHGIDGVSKVVPVVSGSVQVRGSAGYKMFELAGVKGSDLPYLIRGADLLAGRIYDAEFEALVGYKVANPPDLPYPFLTLGTVVNVRGLTEEGEERLMSLRVVGIYEPIGASVLFDPDRTVFVDISTAKELLGRSSYSVILVLVSDPALLDAVASRMNLLYGGRLDIFSASQVKKIYDNIATQINNFLLGIAFISLVVAGVGIANIMMINVVERTREIGVLKALGFTNRDVLLMFLSESVSIGVIGSIVGVAVSIVLAHLASYTLTFEYSGYRITGYVHAAPEFSLQQFALAVFFGILVSLVSGAYPAYRAAKLDPVVAIRYE
uniref:ABC transporter permease n=1 Tax=Fervidicoccus fontis TaxID=683846 RepID=A0A7J3ZLF3_9CREN